MTTKKVFSYFLLAISFFLFRGINVYAAGSTNLSLGGSSSVIVGNNVEVTINLGDVSSIPGGVSGINGVLNYDSSYLEFVNSQSLAPFGMTYVNSSRKFAGFAVGNNITASTSLVKIVFRAKQVGKVNLSISGIKVTDASSDAASVTSTAKTITINPVPSSNANLANLSLSNGSINFNKDTINYSVNVESDVSSINVSASAEDSGAKISGLGTKNLNYGNNTIKVVVTAASGATKTYTITVNRKDNRSNNNNLSNLSVNTGTFSPKFNVNTTTYNMEVPFDTASINVSATCQDSKAKVSGLGTKNLSAGKNNVIRITVTAENGLTKTYTLNVRRGADPNKEQSKDNNLASLSMKDAKLSPEFNKDTLEYKVTVPYSVKKAEFIYTLSDKEFASVKLDNPERLKIGENKITLTVVAENGDEKEYVIIVTRETSPDGVLDPEDMVTDEPVNKENEKIDFGLKDIVLKNGKLKTKFDTKTHIYKYKKSKNFSYEALKNNEDDSMEIFEEKGVITIILENSNGEKLVYTLIPEEFDIIPVIVGGVSIVFVGGGTYLGYQKGLKSTKVRKQKNKKKEESLA